MAASVHHSTSMARLDIDDHNPDIFTIICFNDSFQLALDLTTIATLLRVCKQARPLLSSKVPRFHTWCQNAGLCNPDGQLRFALTPSDQIALSLHCEDQATADRSWLEDRAEQGNASASYFLARILQVDQESENDDELEGSAERQHIFRLLEKAANTSHPMAQFHLAGCYRNGLGVDPDHTKAIQLYRSLADRGVAQAQVALGRCYESGEGVDQDYDTAIEWYSKAADQGSEDGRLHILFLRGWFSFIGHGVEQSDVDAFNRWQEVSTQSTDPVIKPIATHMVGWMHYLGRGTMRDEQKGVKIIRDTKSEDFPLGEEECLAAIWGSLSSPDTLTVHKFFELCQLGSDSDWLCKHLIAVGLIQVSGEAQHQTEASRSFEQLAKNGHSDSQFWLGQCRRYYQRLPRDSLSIRSSNAFECYSKAAAQGHSYAQWMVGRCYDSGTGVAMSPTKAIEWFRKSAKQGSRYGQNELGNCYLKSRGIARNIDTAVFWYRKAAEQGLEEAIDSLQELGQWP